jgi:Sec-independent protein translocase protein TatA
MSSELLQPSRLMVIGGIVFLFFGGRWFARAGLGFRDAVRNFRSGLRTKGG